MSVSQLEASNTSTATSDNSDKRRRFNTDQNEDSTDPKPYKCRFCSKKFRKSQALGGHMNSHRQEREEEQLDQAKKLIYERERGGLVGSFRPTFPNPESAKSLPNLNSRLTYPLSSPLPTPTIHQNAYHPSPLSFNHDPSQLSLNHGCLPSQTAADPNIEDWISKLISSNKSSLNPLNQMSRSTNFDMKSDSVFGSSSTNKEGTDEMSCDPSTKLLNNTGSMHSTMATRFNTAFQTPTAAVASYSGANLLDAEYGCFAEHCNQASQQLGYGSDLLYSPNPVHADFEWVNDKGTIGYAPMQNDDARVSDPMSNRVSASSLPLPQYQPFRLPGSIDMMDVGKETSPFNVNASYIDAEPSSMPAEINCQEAEINCSFNRQGETNSVSLPPDTLI